MLKKKGKELNCSINDIISTCTSRMFKQYLVEKANDTKTNNIRVTMPLSLRPPPKKINEVNLCNQFAIVPMDLKLVDDVDNGLRIIQKDMNAMKNSMEPLGHLYNTKVLMQLPNFIRSNLLEIFT